jgi:outer membrane lipoprotein carrier protein
VQKQGDNVFVLQSKSSDEAFEMISIAFAGANPVQLVLKDALGQKTVVNFNKVKLNMPIDANVFKFVPPPGVDVIEQ